MCIYYIYISFNIYLHVLIFSKPQLARKDCEEAPDRSSNREDRSSGRSVMAAMDQSRDSDRFLSSVTSVWMWASCDLNVT